jgi:gliding motility-associated-like protein
MNRFSLKIRSNFLFIVLFGFLFFVSKNLKSQTNDNCENAIFLNDISNYCSGPAFYTNSGSTASGFGLPSCWGATATEDIWFTFTATGSDVLISAAGSGNGGTMLRPRIAIYTGSCLGTINQLNCSNGTSGSGTTQLYQGALTPGTVYLIRISTTSANEGSFELCVNNYTPSANAGADCGGAAFLCNDNSISVGSLSGGGANTDEPESSTCLESPGADEGNSSWYYWTAGTSGQFAFDITPVDPNDDIDFILYQLNGTNPCGSRTPIRCNASSCLNSNGSTGLSYSDSDINEDSGCDFGENAYCSAVNMVAGTSYALLVNNFSAANGFTINFNTITNGGSIRGPLPVISTNTTTICAGNSVIFNGNNSSNVGGGLNWNFVNGGSPTNATGNGPHTVTYSNAGNYTAILTGTDNNGCNKTESVIINVNTIPNPPTVSNLTYCQNQNATALNAGGSNLLWYSSATGGVGSITAPIPSTSAIGTTSYYVSQTINGCESQRAQINVTVNAGPTVNQITDIISCEGQSINSITFTGTTGATFNWTNNNTSIGLGASGTSNTPSFNATNSGNNAISGLITVTPTLSGCTGSAISFSITINPEITPTFTQVNAICNGQTLNPLPTTSDNGITGSWSPALDNTQTTTYTFSPTTGQCALTAQMTITVNPGVIPTFTQVSDICAGGSLNALPNTSDNGVAGTWTPAINNLQTTTYTFTPSVAACVTNVQMTIIVKPVPTLQAISSQTVCANSATSTINFSSTPTGTIVNWTNDNTAIGLSSTGNGNINSFTGTNSGINDLIGSFSATPTLNGCSGNTEVFSITVTPIPTLNSVANQNLCAGQDITPINFAFNPSNATISWTNTTTSIGLAANGNGNIPAFTTVNGGTTVQNAVLSAYAIANACSSSVVTFTITVNPIPTLTTITSQTVCAGSQSNPINFNVLPANASVSWTNSNTQIGIAASGNGNINAITLQNSGNSPLIGLFQATPNFAGCVGTIESFSITVNPLPILTAVTSQTLCAGISTNYIAFNLSPVSATVNWTNSNTAIGIGSNGTGDIPIFTATNATNGAITGLFNATPTLAGCNGSSQNFSIEVNPIPIIQAIQDKNFCAGTPTSPINFNVQPSNSVITWSNSNTLIGLGNNGNGNIPSFNPLNSSNSTISGAITVNANFNGCDATAQTFNINVNLTPIILLNSNSPVCVNNTINLSSSGGNSYSWQGPLGFTSTLQNPVINNATSSMSGTYSLTITEATGNCQSSSTINVVVNPLPVLSAISNSPICIGGTINLSANANNVISFSWVGPDNFSSTSFNPSISNATLSMSGNYTLTVQSTQGCFNASVINVSVNAQPSTPIVSPIRLCQNSSALPLVAVPDAGGNLNWYGNNATGGVASTSAPIPSTTNLGTMPYYVSQTIQGCESPRININVTVLALPVGIINSIQPKCAPLCNRFVMTSSSAINQYQWNMGNGLLTANNDTINHCYPFSGRYSISVKITDTSGCFNTLQFPDWVTVYENPIAGFNSNPSEVTLLDPTVQFENQSIGDSIISYYWNFGDLTSFSSSQINTSHTYNNLGTYTVTLIVKTTNGCTDTTKGVIEITEDINVYIPNSFSPNDDELNEDFYPQGTGISEEKYQMQIFDRWGELVFSTNNLSEHWKGLRLNGAEPVLQDTYIYKIDLQTVKGNKINKIGHVTVIR